MRILFACGGTGGHINPALAVARTIKNREPDAKILFAGNPHGMEAKLVPQAGYDFVPIKVKGFQRQLNWHNIKNNLLAVAYLTTAGSRAKQILRDFQPDIVMGTGGYVSGPVVMKAAKLGYKTITHEQNAFPGVTTKLLGKVVDKMLLAVEEAKRFLPEGMDYSVVGNPVREEFLLADRNKARKALGVGNRVCILSYGGSLGARRINEAVADLMKWHCGTGKVYHIHATGSYGVELLPELLRERGVNPGQYDCLNIREYIDNMGECYAAADLIISRAGAITLSELQVAGRASVLIPSPNVAENHQYHNAMVLAGKDAAVVIEEKNLTGQLLCETVEQLISTPGRLKTLGDNAQSMAVFDSSERIYQEIRKLMAR